MASVLIIGSGAREFIFAQTFSQTVDEIFIAPGNDGMRAAGECVRQALKRSI